MKIVVVEDQVMIRELLLRVCEATFKPEVLGQAADGATALARCREIVPDLVLLDLELPDQDGLDLLPELRRLAPSARFIALSSHTDEVTVDRVMRSHIEGFLDKNEQPVDALKEAVAAVLKGNTYFSPVVHEVWRRLREEPFSFNKLLSEREQEILVLIGRGYTNSEIAALIDVRAVTVQNHRCNIMAKLGLHSTSHLIRYATEKGFTRLRSGDAKAP